MNPITDSERLPLRLEDELVAFLGRPAGDAEIGSANPDTSPTVKCTWSRPAASGVSLLIRVHSAAGIPLASATVQVNPGDLAVETPPLTMLAMEGYAHLKPADRRAVERRVWSRRAYATITNA